MNRELVITEDKFLAFTDEGNIKIIKGNDEEKIKHVLEKENKIEVLNNEIEELKARIIIEIERIKDFKGLKKLCFILYPLGIGSLFLIKHLYGSFDLLSLMPSVGLIGGGILIQTEATNRVKQINNVIDTNQNAITKKEENIERLKDSLVFDKVKANYEEKIEELLPDEVLSEEKVKVLKLSRC